MSAAAFWPAAGSDLSKVFPDPSLAAAGVLALGLVPMGALWAALDPRLVGGEGVPLKPTRFALSIGVYLLTVCWMLGYGRPERLSSPGVRGAMVGLLAGAGVELFCIVLQAVRGRRSYLNLATPLDAAVSGIMGVTALLFVGMVLPLAWEILRRPRPEASTLMVGAIVAGLVTTFCLGGLTGVRMGEVAAGGVVPNTLRLPLLGSVRGGAPRLAHFLGVHAMQAFPLMALGAQLLRGRSAPAVLVLVAGANGYVLLTLALLAQPASLTNAAMRVRDLIALAADP